MDGNIASLIELGYGALEGVTSSDEAAQLARPHVEDAVKTFFLDLDARACIAHDQTRLRLGAVIAAMALSPDYEWQNELFRHYAERRDFMVHAYLQAVGGVAIGKRLRRAYGARRRNLNFSQCEALALPLAEIEEALAANKIVWPAPHFMPDELACNGTATLFCQPFWFNFLETLRHDVRTLDEVKAFGEFGEPDPDAILNVNSFWRHRDYNVLVPGAARKSPHTKAEAVDIDMSGHVAGRVIRLAQARGMKGLLEYANQGFIHLDTVPRQKVMDGAFPRRSAARVVATEAPRIGRRKTADAWVGAGGIGAAGVVIAEKVDTLQDVQSKIEHAESVLGVAEDGHKILDRAGALIDGYSYLILLGLGLCYVIWSRYKWLRLKLTRLKERIFKSVG